MMKPNFLKTAGGLTLLALALASQGSAQNARVEVGKSARAIPKSCENVNRANIDASVDIPALVKEAICKGAGDMLADYTYTVNALKREKDKNGKVKEETYVYEVFIPTLKGGTRTKGVLVVTSHNGVAVPPRELEKARLEAAEKIEKEENKIALTETPATRPDDDKAKGLLPLGMYTRTSISRSSFGSRKGGVTLAIADFLRASDLTLARREMVGGRDTLVFNFVPRAGTQLIDNEKYMAQITGEIWIDVADRIVTRLIGWSAAVTDPNSAATLQRANQPPAVLVQMMRLPEHAIWLPYVIRINGADYQTLFDGIKTDSISIYSNYIRFSSDVKDAEISPSKNP
jgi:hypothetical protein